ncbi:lactate dehydrogenase [Lactobacillus sp. S2-2]|uniref:NAD(P)-dependent oxidoreductase n=1 Tax=Lactobacillus sp. S2-2 TaxID=2692917 RepID=UPI001F1ADBE9|nr:lactate dehydrogenase [Lactobacillus sp. S2-2]
MNNTKITVYNVKDVEKQYFIDLNKYDFDLNLVKEPLSINNVKEAKESIGVLVDGSSNVDKQIVEQLADFNVKYLFTRFVGYNNIDIKTAKEHGIEIANVRTYSPYSVAELALSLGLDLFRHTSQATFATHNGNFKLMPNFFSNEIHDATVGIIGVGHMGAAEAHLYKALGASVLGYQRHPNDNPDVKFVSQEELLKQSDIISLHVPYIPGENENMISNDEINLMKNNAILINTARGPLVNTNAVSDALKNNSLGGYGTDVIVDEDQINGNEFNSLDDLPDKDLISLMKNYPNVIVTPHMGYFTKPATKDMIKTSYDNFQDIITTGTTKNLI